MQEWAAKHIAVTVAGAAGEGAEKYQKSISKVRFPWAEFGFPEMVGDVEEDDDEEYLTPKPPPPHREEGDNPEFDYILGEGNMKGALKDNAKIGNMELAVATTIAR